MRIDGRLLYLSALLSLASVAQAHGDMAIHDAFRLEMDAGQSRDGQSEAAWNLDGWVGGDNHKLWLKSEGEMQERKTEHSETWAMYSYNFDTFWDVQAGIRHDSQPDGTSYAVFGFTGLAPYWFETEVHVSVSEQGDASLRLREENDVLLTQKLVLQPNLELNAYGQADKTQGQGTGLANIDAALQLRYEVDRQFAPYLEIRGERLFGETADLAEGRGESRTRSSVSAGLRWMF